jgi:quercetin dioxygenase-like cupin family protein
MDIKINEATRNRPEGTRALDAPGVLVDLDQYKNQLKYEDAWQKNDRNGITVFKTDGCTMVLTALHTGAVIDEYKVKGIVIAQVLEGRIIVNAGSEAVEAAAGQLISLHDQTQHSIEALEESVVLLTVIGEQNSNRIA